MSTAARVRSWAQKHTRFSVLLLLEGVFLLFLLVTAFRPLAQITVPLEGTGRVAAQLQIPVEGEVPAGGYRITVQYACDAPQDTERSAPQTVGTLLFTSAGNPAAVRSDAITLTDVHSTVTARLWVATGNTVGDLLMTAAPLYYCDLFLYLPALLYNAFVPLQVCYQIYAVLVNAATMLLAYYSFARMGRNRLYGAAAAFAYTLCAYRLTNLLLRASVGEYTAMAFLPLVVLGAWAIAGEERPAARDWLPLAIGMAGIVQSHLLTTELAALFLALFWLWHLPRMLRPGRLLAALKAVAVAAGLSAWFLLPCLDTMQNEYNMMSDIHSSPIQSTGAYLIQILGLFGAPSGGSGPGTTGDMPLTLGLAGTLVLVLAVRCILRRRR